MSTEARIESLTTKHQHIENTLHHEANHANPNQDVIAQLKRQKLAIKDEIEGLRMSEASESAA